MGGAETFNTLLNYLEETVETFIDDRQGSNKQYRIREAVFAAFSVFFTQSPSFLAFQTLMEKNKGINNARTLFGLEKIPSDNQIRNLLDPTPAEILSPFFLKVFSYLEEKTGLDSYRSINNSLLVILDGTGYFYSEKLHCPLCSEKHHKDGRISYSHSAITPVIATPGCPRVISLPPEFIRPQDGAEKEDCENQAAKRWLKKWGEVLQDKNITIVGDDLYSRQPVIEEVKAQNLHFLFVCKPQSHPWLSEYIANCDPKVDLNEFCLTEWTGKERLTYTYRWRNGVPLRDSKDALAVNWVSLTITNEKGEITFRNAYITDHHLNL